MPGLFFVPGMNRLRKRPAYAGVVRLLDVGWTRAWIFPPEPPLLPSCADATRLTEEGRPLAPSASAINVNGE
jgi:hypothetical protein